MTEKEILNIGHTTDFKRFFNGHYVALCLFAESYLNSSEDAADTVQEAFIKLWQRRYDFNNACSVKSFLYITVRNDALNRLAHQKVKGKYHRWFLTQQGELFFHDQVIEQESFRLLWKAIHALPEQTRKVMLLALEGNDNSKIAVALGMAKETVHTHKKIAYKRLREYLKDIFPMFVWLFLETV